MIKTPRVLELLADRIECAYLHRHPDWRSTTLDRRLWTSAASILIDAHATEPWVPLDPELFVASQINMGLPTDPWIDLTRRGAKIRYMRRVREIIRILQTELAGEIRWAASRLARGAAPEAVLLIPTRRMSALSRYITAIRLGRHDLADQFRSGSVEQHDACPLYRVALQKFLASEDFPVESKSMVSLALPDAVAFRLN